MGAGSGAGTLDGGSPRCRTSKTVLDRAATRDRLPAGRAFRRRYPGKNLGGNGDAPSLRAPYGNRAGAGWLRARAGAHTLVPYRCRHPKAGAGHRGGQSAVFDPGFCILILAHFGHFHLRCLWKTCPFNSFIGILHLRQVTRTSRLHTQASPTRPWHMQRTALHRPPGRSSCSRNRDSSGICSCCLESDGGFASSACRLRPTEHWCGLSSGP